MLWIDAMVGLVCPLDALGVTAGGAWGPGDDLSTDPARIDTIADGDHRAGYAGAGHIGWLQGEVLATPATAQLRVEEQDLGDGDLDDDPPRSGARFRRVAGDQYFWTAEPDRVYHSEQRSCDIYTPLGSNPITAMQGPTTDEAPSSLQNGLRELSQRPRSPVERYVRGLHLRQ